MDDEVGATPTGSTDVPLGPWVAFSSLNRFVPAGDVPHSAHRVGNDAGKILRSADAVADLKAPQPSGAVLVEAPSRTRRNSPDQYFVMERASSGWTYRVVDPRGMTLAAGNLPLCARCHAEAGAGEVFLP